MPNFSSIKMFDIHICFREILGPDLVFIILDMSQEDRRKRVLKRHDGSEGAADLMDVRLNIIKHTCPEPGSKF